MVDQLGGQASTLEDFTADIAAAEKRANEHFGLDDDSVDEDNEEEDEDGDEGDGDGEEEESEHDSEEDVDEEESEGDSESGATDEGDDDHDKEDNEPAQKATKKTKAKPAKDGGESSKTGRDEPSDDDVSILRAQAKKLGFELDKGQKTVSIPERTAFRAKMARDRGKLDQQIHAAQTQLQERGERLAQKFSKSQKLEAAIEAQDHDGMARAVGFANYRAMNENFIQKAASPDYLKNQAMEKKIAAMEKREQDQREEMGRAAKEREQRANDEEWDEELRGYLANDTDEITRELSKETDFIDYMNTYLKGANGAMSVQEARDLAVTELRKEQVRLNRIFGAPGGSTPSSEDNAEMPVDGAPVEKKKRSAKRRSSKSISQKDATDASNKSPRKEWSDDKYFKYWAKKMEDSKK